MIINQNSLKQAEYARTQFRLNTPKGVTLQDILKQEAWAHVARQIVRGTLIEVFAEDNTFFATLICTAVGSGWAEVKTVSYTELSPAKKAEGVSDSMVEERAKFSVSLGSGSKFRVVRNSDKAVVASAIPSEEAAARWIDAHIKDTILQEAAK